VHIVSPPRVKFKIKPPQREIYPSPKYEIMDFALSDTLVRTRQTSSTTVNGQELSLELAGNSMGFNRFVCSAR
jgi:preprotein translocase subunit SecF